MDDQIKRWRGGLLVAFVGFSLLTISKWTFSFLCIILLYLAVDEFIRISQASGAKPLDKVLKILCPLCIVFATFSYNLLCSWLAIACIIILCSFVLRSFYGPKIEVSLSDVASSFFCLAYIGWLPSHIILLRFLDNSSVHWNLNRNFTADTGLFCALFPIVSIVVNDIASYYFGKLFGRTKLAQSISPNKTIKGAVAGITCGTIVAIILLEFLAPQFKLHPTFLQIIAFSLLCNVLAQLGDLAESLMKRSAGLKDAGYLIEGHGGLMDRFDSHILPYVISYYFFRLHLAVYN